MITLKLKDGVEKQYEPGMPAFDIARDISEGLARNACAVEINGKLSDLRTIITEDIDLNILTFNDIGGKWAFRHTASHILAQAVKRLYPNAKLAIGPAIDDGFYYDFDVEKPFTLDDLKKIETEMKKIVKEELPIERFEMPKNEAIAYFEGLEEVYKTELVSELPEGEIISFYKQGEFTDLCAGPHLMNTKYVKAIKLTNEAGSSGAYWRGSEKNKMLARIYGTAFTKNADLEEYIKQREEAKKRDHNKLGRELGLFTTSDVIGQGLPLIMPKGVTIMQTLQRFVEDEEERRGYVRTKTPIMAKSDLYKISGHWDLYKDGMFILGEENSENDGNDSEVFALRPMTCPFQFTIYKAEQHSYRDLPIRYGETATLFRNESSGEMHGLIRVRQFTISEGHIVCTREQLEQEFFAVIDLINFMMKTLGIDKEVSYRFSKWDPNSKAKYVGEHDVWEETQDLMRKMLQKLDISFTEAEGEAAFYGPKLDIQFKNVFGKEDTIITAQIDFALAERFGMYYIDMDGTKKHPIIIHRTSIGCYERTLAMLIEKYAGAFPTWLCPIQAAVLSISEKYNDYANQVAAKLRNNGIRVSADCRAEKIGYKIREARSERIPYLLVVGEKEQENNEVSLRSRTKGDEGSVSLDMFIERICKEIREKSYEKPIVPAE